MNVLPYQAEHPSEPNTHRIARKPVLPIRSQKRLIKAINVSANGWTANEIGLNWLETTIIPVGKGRQQGR
jgi:hypothetical protein